MILSRCRSCSVYTRYPLNFISLSCGTNCVTAAFTAGVCIPVPTERIADILTNANSIGVPSEIFGKKIANKRVAAAIIASDNIINFFFEYLSASTPEKHETKNCGTKAAIVMADTHPPDEVCPVTYQINANCARDEPNNVIP